MLGPRYARGATSSPFHPLESARCARVLMAPRCLSQEQEQLKAIRDELANKQPAKSELDKDFEGGFGGQEDLEDRYATTLGEH